MRNIKNPKAWDTFFDDETGDIGYQLQILEKLVNDNYILGEMEENFIKFIKKWDRGKLKYYSDLTVDGRDRFVRNIKIEAFQNEENIKYILDEKRKLM